MSLVTAMAYKSMKDRHADQYCDSPGRMSPDLAQASSATRVKCGASQTQGISVVRNSLRGACLSIKLRATEACFLLFSFYP